MEKDHLHFNFIRDDQIQDKIQLQKYSLQIDFNYV